MNALKLKVAEAAIDWLEAHHLLDNTVIGVGTGSTVNYFIDALATMKHRIDACVASSIATEKRLRERGLPILDLNVAGDLPVYVDGADEVNLNHEMIKGGGGALTREKIVASVARQFICIVDQTKVVETLGQFPIAIEVIPMARSYVAREIVKLGGDPIYREGLTTDNGNIILDVFNLKPMSTFMLEDSLNCIPGVVENGLFIKRRADQVLVARDEAVHFL